MANSKEKYKNDHFHSSVVAYAVLKQIKNNKEAKVYSIYKLCLTYEVHVPKDSSRILENVFAIPNK